MPLSMEYVFEARVKNVTPEVHVFSKDFPNLDHQLISMISTSSAREGEEISDISWCSVWLE